jgi:hypothetical protein
MRRKRCRIGRNRDELKVYRYDELTISVLEPLGTHQDSRIRKMDIIHSVGVASLKDASGAGGQGQALIADHKPIADFVWQFLNLDTGFPSY